MADIWENVSDITEELEHSLKATLRKALKKEQQGEVVQSGRTSES